MFLRSETWGHVALGSVPTPEMIAREEQGETEMMRCRHGRLALAASQKMLDAENYFNGVSRNSELLK